MLEYIYVRCMIYIYLYHPWKKNSTSWQLVTVIIGLKRCKAAKNYVKSP